MRRLFDLSGCGARARNSGADLCLDEGRRDALDRCMTSRARINPGRNAGTFWSAYCGNREEAVEGVIDADPIAAAVRAVMAMRGEWMGTASELLGALAEMAGERVAKSKTWPDSPRALAGRLRRAATFLRKIGIEISFGREGRARTRTITITTTIHPEPD